MKRYLIRFPISLNWNKPVFLWETRTDEKWKCGPSRQIGIVQGLESTLITSTLAQERYPIVEDGPPNSELAESWGGGDFFDTEMIANCNHNILGKIPLF